MMEMLLMKLRAAAEPTRLRILALCALDELTVTDLTHILGQSQPRVSRHLKLLCDAGLLARTREGTSIFHRLADGANDRPGAVARLIVGLVPEDDPQIELDRRRLDAIKQSRAEAAQAYFRANAKQWDRIRSLHIDEAEVERSILEAMPQSGIEDLLDFGTGTGRMLVLLANRIGRGVGIDLSREMLDVARTNLEAAGFANCQVRRADMYRAPFPDASFDAVTIHQVLHYADNPSWVIAEAARLLRPGGMLVIADFAPHEREELRREHAHRRLGFSDADIEEWFRRALLSSEAATHLPGDPLTVVLWIGRKAPLNSKSAPRRSDARLLEEELS